MTAAPLFSVIVPVRDRAPLLRRALDSVIAQELGDWEAVVADDGSRDRPEAVASALGDPRIRVIRLPQARGPAAARNAGLRAARGRLVAFLDSDDVWRPDKLGRQAERLAAPGGPGIHVCGAVQRGPGGDRRRPARDQREGERIASFLYVANGFAQASCVAARADAARRAGFDETLRQYEDHLFLIRAEALGARVEVSGPPLAVQHVDARADRLGARDDAARARAFLASAEGLLTRRERTGFALRCLGAGLARESPAAARRLALAGMADPPLAGAALKLMLRASFGAETYARAGRLLRAQAGAMGGDRRS